MSVVKDLKKAVESSKEPLKSKNLEEILMSLNDAGYYIKEKQYEKAYHALDMASIGIAVEKISIIKKDVKDEKSN